MSLKKKIVWLPYDMDTAIGTNNEGSLVFDYELEDIDTLAGGAEVFNGQQSVLWKNIRAAFGDELAAMYKTLRSQGKLSYDLVEQMFEEHQAKWPEAIFNEDSWFKYIDPLINDGNGAYLPMLQGSKAEQRKWWLYNRFRYIDSKYNAGDALSDLIQVRGYAKADITVTPYADIYPTVKYGSYLVSARGKRGTETTLVCPLDNVNDTEIYIYSASQLASVGDLSGLKVGFADFSMATRLQSLKLGDSSLSYENQNLNSLTLGNNVLLQTIDIRNCSAMGTGDQKTIDLSGCEIIENVYMDGTAVTGVSLPNGGVLKVLSLPATITNLTVLNQPSITTFSMEGTDYSSITTLRIENSSSVIPVDDILADMPANSRVRLIGFTTSMSTTSEVEDFYDYLDTMRGLDEQGNNLDHAVVQGTITGLGSITGAWYAEMKARYPYIDIGYEHISANLKFYNGETLLQTVSVTDGGDGTYSGTTPTKANSSDGHYSYTFAGWSKDTDDGTVDSDALTGVETDRNVYACFTSTVRTYTVTWKNADNTTLETDNNVPWGTVPSYNGATPTYGGQTSQGWSPDPTQPITGNTTFTAQYLPVYTVTFYNGSTVLQTSSVVQGQNATYTGSTPVNSEDATLAFLGWTRTSGSTTVDSTALNNIQANTNIYAVFKSAVEVAEITDSWDTIIANIDNGTYSTKYNVGNYKPLDLGTEGTINMQIVAMDADELASGNRYAPLTFLGMELLNSDHRMNATNITEGGWEATEMRTYLKGTIKPLIPANVRARINNVTKYSKIYRSGSVVNNVASTEDVWIPSIYEIGLTIGETQGVKYNSIFKDVASRIKSKAGTSSASWWWLRSANNSYYFNYVNNTGSYGYNNHTASTSGAVCLGFCLGLES